MARRVLVVLMADGLVDAETEAGAVCSCLVWLWLGLGGGGVVKYDVLAAAVAGAR